LCGCCGHGFSSRAHVLDLIEVERQLGYRYEIPGSEAEHYQWICPPCRRASFVIAQGLMWRQARGGAPLPAGAGLLPTPTYVNSGRGEGPLDTDDAENFHP